MVHIFVSINLARAQWFMACPLWDSEQQTSGFH